MASFNYGSIVALLLLALPLDACVAQPLATVHLKQDLAVRAVIRLTTSSLDGKQEPLTWYFHSIPIAKYIKDNKQKVHGEQKKD